MKNSGNIVALLAVVIFAISFTNSAHAFQIESADKEHVDPNDGKWISAVEFVGNKDIAPSELLRVFNFDDDIAGKVNRLFVHPYHKKEIDLRFKNDLTDFYLRRGYLKVSVGEPVAVPDGESIKLIVTIDEGSRYRYGKVRILGVKKLGLAEVEQFLNFSQGQIANAKELQRKVNEELPKYCGSKGFARCTAEIDNLRIRPVSMTTMEGVVDFDVVVDEGKLYRVKQINITGDTGEKMVRPYITFKEGEPFNSSKIDETVKRLNESDRFRKIDTDIDVGIEDVPPEENLVEITSKSGIKYKIRPDDAEVKAKEEAFGELVVYLRIGKRQPQPVRNYYISSVKFIGNKTISDAELKSALGLQDNAYFDVKSFIKSVREFNALGRCKPITENDIDIEVGLEGKQDDDFSEQLNLTVRCLPLTPNRTATGR